MQSRAWQAINARLVRFALLAQQKEEAELSHLIINTGLGRNNIRHKLQSDVKTLQSFMNNNLKIYKLKKY